MENRCRDIGEARNSVGLMVNSVDGARPVAPARGAPFWLGLRCCPAGSRCGWIASLKAGASSRLNHLFLDARRFGK